MSDESEKAERHLRILLDALKNLLLSPDCRHAHDEGCTVNNCAVMGARAAISIVEKDRK